METSHSPIPDALLVLSTCASAEEAARIAHSLVESRLAACVNIVPSIRSVYRWRDMIEDATESLIIVKTNRTCFPALQAELARLHSYEIPEILAVSIAGGAEGYLNWLALALASPEAAG